MTVKHLGIEDLKNVARAGGGLRVNTPAFPVGSLASLARAAKGKGAVIILEQSAELSADDMAKIARAGDGCVMFE